MNRSGHAAAVAGFILEGFNGSCKQSTTKPAVWLGYVLSTVCAIVPCCLSALGQTSTNYRVPLVYGYQSDPMMVYANGYYNLYVDDQMGYDRIRKSASLAGLVNAEPEVVYVGTGGVAPAVSCSYLFHWNSRWYQYCGDSTGNLVLESSADDPSSSYTFLGRLDAPSGFTGYAEWPIMSNGQIYMLITTNGEGVTYNSIYAAKFSDPATRTGSWNLISVPAGGSGSWECGDGRCIDEGGSAVIHGSNIYLLFSAGGYESPDYCVGMLTANMSSDLTQQANWTKSSGCVISRNNSSDVYGPGSAMWFKSPDGTQDWIIYHLKTSTANNMNGDDRKLEAMQVTWDGSGNPVFSQPTAVDTYHTLPSGDPGNELSAPSLSSWSSTRTTADAIGSGNNVYENFWTASSGTWTGWHQVAATPPNGAAMGPAAVSRTTNIIDLVVPTDSLLYRSTWNGTAWSAWSSMGGPSPSCCIGSVAGSKAAMSSWGSDRVDMFTLGLDHTLWQDTWTSETGYSGWTTSLGNPTNIRLIGAPAAISRTSNVIDVFMRGTNGDIYTLSWNGSAWSSWTDLGSCSPGNSSNPAVASWSSTNLQLFERGRDGNIYEDIWNGTGWSGWTSIGAPSVGAVADPAAVSRTSNYTDLFVRGADGNVYATNWTGSAWGSWSSFGEP